MSVVVGVDGSGRTHRLHQLAASAGGAVTRIDPPVSALPPLDGALVVVDDLHKLDPGQLSALAEAARRGVPMLVARRPTIAQRELAELDEAVARQGSVELLAPLSDPEAGALVARLTGRPVAPEVGVAIHAATAGLPALVAAASSAAGAAAGAASAATTAGAGSGGIAPGAESWATPTLVARVQRRLAQFDEPVAALARLLALRLDLGDGLLAAATGLDEQRVAVGMRTLRDEGLLVSDGEAMIPVVAAAVLAELPAAQRRRVHDDLARALVAVGGDPMVTAVQLRSARAYTPAAGQVYLTVAERLRFSDPAAAAGWYEDAADAGADPALVAVGRAETAALLGLAAAPDGIDLVAEALDAAGGATAGGGTAGGGTAGGGTPDGGRMALVGGAVQAHEGRPERAAETLLAAQPPGPVLAVPALVATGRLADAQGVANGAGPAAVRMLAEAAVVAGRDPAGAVPLLIEAAELAERAVPPVVLPDTPHALGALAATLAGDVGTAEHLLERALRAGTGGPGAQDRHRLLLAFVRMRAGRYDTAVQELSRLATAALRGRERLLYAALAAGVARRSGDVAKLRDAWTSVEPALARRTVDLFTAEAVEELAVAATRLRREARVEPVLAALDAIVARLGNPAAWAVAVGWIRLQAAIAHEGEAGPDASGVAEALGTAGQGSGARQAAQAAAARLWADLLAGRVDPDAVLAAGERLAEVELPWEGSRLVGQAAIRTTDASAARRLLERARELSSAEVTTASRRAAGSGEGRPEGQGGLSEREVEVAQMVLAGSTYREIGSRLFISPKTVEHHVARIRTKLGANSRAEFVAALRDLLEGA